MKSESSKYILMQKNHFYNVKNLEYSTHTAHAILHSSALFWVDSWLIALTSLMKNYQKRGGGQWAYYSTTFWLTRKKLTKWPWPIKCMGSNIYKNITSSQKSDQTALKWE